MSGRQLPEAEAYQHRRGPVQGVFEVLKDMSGGRDIGQGKGAVQYLSLIHILACPQNAKEIRNDVASAKALIAGESPVYASIAPSLVANYDGVTIKSMDRALKRLGFAGAEETAVGATIVKRQYDLMANTAEQDVIISSCCSTINLLIQKHYPQALPYLAHVISPMPVSYTHLDVYKRQILTRR